MPPFQVETDEEGEPRWCPVERVPDDWMRRASWPLLSEQGPLTARIRSRCPDSFRLELISEGAAVLDDASAEWLGEPAGSPAHRREVRLWCGSAPVVYGMTLFPARFEKKGGGWLEHLGTRPLGDAFFALPGGRRRELSVARVAAESRLARRARSGMGERGTPAGDAMWARRSLLETDTLRLLVTECLLGNV